jgi:6-phosphofructokinase 2
MTPIVTLTVNPAIDAYQVADEIVPVRKIRTRDEHYAAGGGGLNVARVVEELGVDAVAFYLAGGLTGQALEGMVEKLGIAAVRVAIGGATRVSQVVLEASTGQEYRFTPEGPEVSETEWRHCLEVLSVVDADYFVASGSLARGCPADFYARVARGVKARGGRMVVDTSGAALHLGAGGGRPPRQAEPARAGAAAPARGRQSRG